MNFHDYAGSKLLSIILHTLLLPVIVFFKTFLCHCARQQSSKLFLQIGKPNQGFYMMMNELPQERLLIGTICAASMEFMFESTRNYVAERKAFGGTLAKLQTIQHKIAEVYTGKSL